MQGACVAVAALMQYFLMAAFCWMLVEGIYLYLFVVKVYNINNKMNVYYVMSWGKLSPPHYKLTPGEMLIFTFFAFLLFKTHCRFSGCYGCNLAKYCIRKRRNPELCQWGIVRNVFLYVSSPFSYLIHQVDWLIFTNLME